MELWRRWILLLCTTVGIFLAMYASLAPKVALQAVDFANSQKSESGWDERTAYLQQLSLPEYIHEKTKDHETVVQEDVWVVFVDDVLAASHGEAVPRTTRRRVFVENRWSSPPFKVFFLPGELPLGDVADQLRKTAGEPHYLVLERPAGKQYLEAVYQTYDSDDFSFGAGLSHPLPTALLYPYRTAGFAVIALGVLAYGLLGWRKRDPDTIYYARWSVIPGDFVAMLLFVCFFTLPMLVIGGAVQAITLAWFLPLTLWPLALLGAWLLIHLAEYAAYEIRILDGGVEVTTCRGQTTVPFAAIACVQPLVLLTPSWLTHLSWLAALTGQGSGQFRMTAQALALSNSAANGLCLRRKDGSAVYLWVPSPTSDKVIKNASRLTNAIEAAAIPWEEDVKVVQALVRPDGEGPDGIVLKQSQSMVLAGLIVLPLAVICIGLVGWLGMDLLDSTGRGAGVDSAGKEDLKRATEVQFARQDVAWEARFRAGAAPIMLIANSGASSGVSAQGGRDTHACGFQQLADGSLLIYGCAGQSSDLNGYVLKTDESGKKQWENQYGTDGEDCDYVTGACPGRDGGFLLLGTSGSYSTIRGGSRAYLVGISASGQKQWGLLWGEGTEFPEPDAAMLQSDGSFTVCGHAGKEPSTTIFLLHISGTGQLITEKQIDAGKELGSVNIMAVIPTEGGGGVVTGEISATGQFKNLLLARFKPDGNLESKHGFGGAKLESGRKVIQTTDGGLLAAGLVDTFDGNVRFYVVRLDAQGNLTWEKTIGGNGQYTLRDVRLTKDGGFLLAGDYRPGADSLPQLLAIRADVQGRIVWEKHLEQPGVVYSGWSSIQTANGATFVLATRTWGNQDLSAISLIGVAP